MISGGPTVYGVLGDWPGYLAVGYIALVYVRSRRRAKAAGASSGAARAA
jgi:hypothetical protein